MIRVRRPLFALGSILALGGCPHPSEPEVESAVPVHCVPVETGAAEELVTLRGPLRPPAGGDAVLSARVPGVIIELPVVEGAHVEKGAVLARLDDRTFRDARLQAAAAVAQATAEITVAQADDARKAKLLERGIVSRAEAESAHATALRAAANHASAEAALDSAKADEERSRITSPIAGSVVRVYVRVGQAVDGSPGQPIVEVAALGKLELRAEVPVGDLVRIRDGQRAEIAVDGVDTVVTAKVAAVSPAVSTETGLGIVRVALPDGTALPIGAMAHARVIVASRPGALLVPEDALRGGAAGGLELVVCAGEKARVVSVAVGAHTAGKKVEILAGVVAGDRVVADGGLSIEDGVVISEAREEAEK